LTRFVFNLETLLRHREDVEQKERDILFRLTYKYQMELKHREDLAVKFQETMKELGLKRAENPGHQELVWFYLYVDRLTDEIRGCEKLLSQLRSEIQAQKEVVIEASKKRKTLTAMKAKKEKAYMVAQEKQEQKEVDELVITRYAGKGNEYPQTAQASKAGAGIKQ
jgi:flagellar export protein FliJ